VFAASAWLHQLSTALEDFYGPRGKLALEQQIGNEISAGSDDLQQSRFAEAEMRYRSAFRLNNELRSILARHGWHTSWSSWPSSEILVGLADSLAGQRRYSEAAKVLEHGAALERELGNTTRAKDLLARSEKTRVKMAGQAR
jgi:hypothetical protein